MASIKHQTASYRTRRGKRFESFTDVCDRSGGDLRAQARALVAELRDAGRCAFIEKMDGGAFYRVFAALSPSA